jgi:hypothetical protein
VCVADPGIINLCRTKFENPYANITEADALRMQSAFFSTAGKNTNPFLTIYYLTGILTWWYERLTSIIVSKFINFNRKIRNAHNTVLY